MTAFQPRILNIDIFKIHVPTGLLKHGGEEIMKMLVVICCRIWPIKTWQNDAMAVGNTTARGTQNPSLPKLQYDQC